MIHPVSAPAADGSLGVDVEPGPAIGIDQPTGVAAAGIAGIKRPAAGIGEMHRAIVQHPDHGTAFMHLAMMKPAQQHQVRQAGVTTVGPVLDVMPVDKPPVGAAGKPAAAVASSCRLQPKPPSPVIETTVRSGFPTATPSAVGNP